MVRTAPLIGWALFTAAGVLLLWGTYKRSSWLTHLGRPVLVYATYLAAGTMIVFGIVGVLGALGY